MREIGVAQKISQKLCSYENIDQLFNFLLQSCETFGRAHLLQLIITCKTGYSPRDRKASFFRMGLIIFRPPQSRIRVLNLVSRKDEIILDFSFLFYSDLENDLRTFGCQGWQQPEGRPDALLRKLVLLVQLHQDLRDPESRVQTQEVLQVGRSPRGLGGHGLAEDGENIADRGGVILSLERK